MNDYRVNLDIYNGPLDLLLYLIRREEVDIHDIPIAAITDQYCAYVETLRQIDPDLAGDFLVMATTLMEIKTRMLLPRPEAETEEGEPIDPRAELVRQLLEYKAFKDAAGDLRTAAAQQALRFPRRPVVEEAEPDTTDIEDVQLWDLVEAFNRLMAATGRTARETEIIYDDTPVELHATDIMDRLSREGNLTFRQIFEGRRARSELVGLFLALLELARRRSVFIEQSSPFAEIYVFVNPDAPSGEESAEDAAEASPGQYVGRPPETHGRAEAGGAAPAGQDAGEDAPESGPATG